MTIHRKKKRELKESILNRGNDDMTEKQFKKLIIVIVVVLIVVFIGIMWGIQVYFNMTYYKEGDYSDHKCSFCDNEAMCKVRYKATIYYF